MYVELDYNRHRTRQGVGVLSSITGGNVEAVAKAHTSCSRIEALVSRTCYEGF